jgi:hypothetical protein
MVVSEDYRHMTIGSLALHAQRSGNVFASPSTWARHAREGGWLRPRRRLYPAKPREGIRAGKPNDYWHIDLTISNTTPSFRMQPSLARHPTKCTSDGASKSLPTLQPRMREPVMLD